MKNNQPFNGLLDANSFKKFVQYTKKIKFDLSIIRTLGLVSFWSWSATELSSTWIYQGSVVEFNWHLIEKSEETSNQSLWNDEAWQCFKSEWGLTSEVGWPVSIFISEHKCISKNQNWNEINLRYRGNVKE